MTNSTYLLASGNLVLGGLVLLLGLVILRENPRHRLNATVAMLLFCGGFGVVLSGLALLSRDSANGAALPANAAFLWQLFFPLAFATACIFPEERDLLRRFRLDEGVRWAAFLLLVVTPHIFHFLLLGLVSAAGGGHGPHFAAPGVLRPLLAVAGVFGRLFLNVHRALFSLVDLGFGGGAIALLLGARRSTQVPRLRRQTGAIAFGLAGCLLLYAGATLVPTLFGLVPERRLQMLLLAGALLAGSGSIAYAMVRHRFLDAKLLARRGILYALATALLIGAYLLAVARLNTFVSGSFGIDARVIQPVILIMALTLFQPAIGWLETSLDQLFLRDPADVRNVLKRLARDLQTTIDLDELLASAAGTLSSSLLLRSAHAVALTLQGPVARSGTGEPLPEEALAAIAALLPRLPREQASFRLSDPVEGLRRGDRELLEGRLGAELMVPLRWRDEVLGVLLVGRKLTGTEFTSEDEGMLVALGGAMGVSMQNALLLRERLAMARLEEELHLAQQIQRAFLRTDFPSLPRCEVHAVNLPSREVGGDYYDVVTCDDGSFYVAIADVSGKGVGAALLSSMLQAALRTQAVSGGSVAGILRGINTLVYRSTAAHQFATFFLARVHDGGRRLTYCNAGHNWPVLLREEGELLRLDRGGVLIGIMDDIELEDVTVPLERGDVLVLYTDGISEASNRGDEMFGEDRVGELLRAMPRELGARAIGDRLLDEVARHLDGVEPQDDRTLVVLRVREDAADAGRAGGAESPPAEIARA